MLEQKTASSAARASGISNLEGKVIQEVCGAIVLVRLAPRTGIYPYTDGRCGGVGGVLSCDGQAILESRCLCLCAEGRGDGSGETTLQGAEGRRGSPAADPLGEVQCESPGGHRELRWGEGRNVVVK